MFAAGNRLGCLNLCGGGVESYAARGREGRRGGGVTRSPEAAKNKFREGLLNSPPPPKYRPHPTLAQY